MSIHVCTCAQVPSHVQSDTPVYMLATAGLRLLSHQQAQDLLRTCSAAIMATPFKHSSEQSQVISGDAEGLYAWAAVNYVTGALEVRKPEQENHILERSILFVMANQFQAQLLSLVPSPHINSRSCSMRS